MNRKQRLLIVVVTLVLFGLACWCLYFAGRYFDAGMWYVAVVSSNPNPPESAELMRRYWMGKSSNWLWTGIGSLVLMIIWLIVNVKLFRRSRVKP